MGAVDEGWVRGHPSLRSTITSRGQITVPVWLRRTLGLRPGDQVCFEGYDVGFVLKRVEHFTPLVDWTGFLAKNCPTDHAVRALRGDSAFEEADPRAFEEAGLMAFEENDRRALEEAGLIAFEEDDRRASENDH